MKAKDITNEIHEKLGTTKETLVSRIGDHEFRKKLIDEITKARCLMIREVKALAKKRNAQRGSALGALLTEADQKWEAFFKHLGLKEMCGQSITRYFCDEISKESLEAGLLLRTFCKEKYYNMDWGIK